MLEKAPHLQSRDDIGFAGTNYTYAYRDNISVDPIGFDAGDVNLMRYVGNDPVNRKDPLGLWSAWGGGSGSLVIRSGQSYSGGIVYDSDNGGWNVYSSKGKAAGVSVGLNYQAGYYSGSMKDPDTSVVTIGGKWFSIGIISNKRDINEFGISISLGPPVVTFPFEAAISSDETEYVYRFKTKKVPCK